MEGSNLNNTLLAKKNRFFCFEFQIFQGQKFNFQKFQNCARGRKFLQTTLQTELIKNLCLFFSKFQFFQGQKLNFRKFQDHFS